MERFNYILKVKKQQKELAKEIRKLKVEQKRINHNDNKLLLDIKSKLYDKKSEYRHQHIAYCVMCGRKRIEIENPRSGNEPKEDYLNDLLAKYEQTAYNKNYF